MAQCIGLQIRKTVGSNPTRPSKNRARSTGIDLFDVTFGPSNADVVEWHTQQFQKLPPLQDRGFESHHRHQTTW